MSRRTNYFGLWGRLNAALCAGDEQYDLQHFDMKYVCNAMEDFCKLEKELEAARAVVEAAKDLSNALTPEERASQALFPEYRNLHSSIATYDALKKTAILKP